MIFAKPLPPFLPAVSARAHHFNFSTRTTSEGWEGTGGITSSSYDVACRSHYEGSATEFEYCQPGSERQHPPLSPGSRTHCSCVSARNSTLQARDQGTSQRSSPSPCYPGLRVGFLQGKRRIGAPERKKQGKSAVNLLTCDQKTPTQFISSPVCRWPIINLPGEALQQPYWHVAILKGQRLAQVPPCGVLCVIAWHSVSESGAMKHETNHSRGIGAEVAMVEEEQRRSQGPRSPIIPMLRRTYLNPYSANCT